MNPVPRSPYKHSSPAKGDPNLEFADWIRATLRQYGLTQKAIAQFIGIRDKNKITKDLSGRFLPTWEYVEATYLRPIESLSAQRIPNSQRAHGLTLHSVAKRNTKPHDPVPYHRLESDVQSLRDQVRQLEEREIHLREQLRRAMQREVDLLSGEEPSPRDIEQARSERERALDSLTDETTLISQLRERIEQQALQLQIASLTAQVGYNDSGLAPGCL